MADGRGIDFLGAVEVADTRQEIAEREDAFDRQIGQAERRGNVVGALAFLDQSREGHPARHIIGREARDILDQRGFDGSGIVACLNDRARQHIVDRLARRTAFGGNEAGGMVAPRARDDLIGVRAAIGADDQRLQNAALADGRQDVRDVGDFLAEPHIGFADRQLVEGDKIEFHVTCSL